MKLNKILMVLAATAIVGCTSEDLNDFTAKQAPEDSRLIELDENFVISGVGVDGAMTRTHWEWDDPATKKTLVNKFLPIYAQAFDADASKKLSKAADLEANAVGLCWLGQTPGAEVYTNYQFYHFGWLNNGETEADVDKCGTLYNGALYSDITMKAGAADAEARPGTDWDAAGLPAKATENGLGTVDILNYNSGVYKTDNKAIFAGDYIVYYPFNKDFDKAGTIPAKAVTEFNDIPANAQFNTAEIGEATFRYSAPVSINGGDQAAGFGMKNLSTLVQVRVATPKGVTITGALIDQVVLYSKNKKLLKQANLAADKIAAGQTGQALYADTEGTQTIIANFVAAGVPLLATNNNPNSAYITVLPTTVDDLVVLVHRKDNGTWAQVAIGNTEFKAGNAQVINATVTEDDFKTEYFAVDQASLFAAIDAADDTHPTEANPATVTLIGDIELTGAGLSIDETAYPYLKYINIEEGAIVIPEGVDLTLQGANVKSDIRVLGTECCSGAATGGRLTIDDGTVVNNVTMEPTEARIDPTDPNSYKNLNPMVTFNNGTAAMTATVAADALFDVQAGTVEIGDDTGTYAVAVEHKGAINIAEGAKLIVKAKGDLQFMGTDVVNDGTIEVMKAGHFDITDADGNASWDDGKNMINNGKFIHNVDASVGTAVQAMQQNGEYRCRVDKQKALDDAYVQWTACSVIEMVKGATSYDLGAFRTHNSKHVDIEVNNTAGTTTFKKDGDNTNILIGNLTVYTPLIVNDEKASDKQRQLTVNGNMTVLASTQLTNSDKITVTKNLDIKGATLTYAAAIVNGLDVTNGDITVIDGTFNASADGAIQIKCKNFSLVKENPAGAGASATFGNRTAGDSAKKTMEVSGTISNPKGCTFSITPAGGTNLLAWITCKKLEVGGAFPGGRPSVIE